MVHAFLQFAWAWSTSATQMARSHPHQGELALKHAWQTSCTKISIQLVVPAGMCWPCENVLFTHMSSEGADWQCKESVERAWEFVFACTNNLRRTRRSTAGKRMRQWQGALWRAAKVGHVWAAMLKGTCCGNHLSPSSRPCYFDMCFAHELLCLL